MHSAGAGASAELATLVAAADASLDGVIVCAAVPPFEVLHVSRAARDGLQLLASLTETSAAVVADDAEGAALADVVAAGVLDEPLERAAAAVRSGARIDDSQPLRDADGALVGFLPHAFTPVGDYLLWAFRRVAADPTAVSAADIETDGLTALGTRVTIQHALERGLARLALGGEGFALVLLDIDGLKNINNTFGYEVGDAVLREVGARLRRFVRGSDAVGRLGGDEFVIVWPGVRTEDDVRALHGRLSATLNEPVATHGTAVRVSVTTGAVLLREPGPAGAENLLRDADAAMYEAKAQGWGSLAFFEAAVRPATLSTLVTAGELSGALRRGELRVHAQPVVDAFSGRTAGVEMLVRWEHPVRGLLTPAEFLPAAHATDLIGEIGAWVLDQAVSWAARWGRDSDMDYFRVGVNISPRQLAATDVVAQVSAALERHQTSPDNLVIEIIESQEIESRASAAEQIRGLIDLGVRVGIDDFGTGFANMVYLRDLPVDMIKVDRTLISLHPSAREETILRAVQSMAAAIGADVVLEGVEHREQVEMARRCGVRFVQGYLIGSPAEPGLARPVGVLPLPPIV